MKSVTVYSKNNCPFCAAAKDMLHSMSIPFTEINVEETPEQEPQFKKIAAKHNHSTFPLILVQDTYIGGYDDIVKLQRESQLIPLVQE